MLASMGQGNDGRGNMYMITKWAEKSLSVYWRSHSAKSAKENKSIHPPCGQFGVLKQSVDTVDSRILVQTYSIYWHWINYIRVSLQFFVQLYSSCYLLFESHPNKANIWQTFIVYPAFFCLIKWRLNVKFISFTNTVGFIVCEFARDMWLAILCEVRLIRKKRKPECVSSDLRISSPLVGTTTTHVAETKGKGACSLSVSFLLPQLFLPLLRLVRYVLSFVFVSKHGSSFDSGYRLI